MNLGCETTRTDPFTSLLTHTVAVTIVVLAWSSLAFCDEIYDAAKRGDLETVTALLKANPDLVFSKNDSYRATPLHGSAEGGRKDMAQLLLTNKADVNAMNKWGWTPLHLAVDKDSKDVAELLMTNKAEINAKG